MRGQRRNDRTFFSGLAGQQEIPVLNPLSILQFKVEQASAYVFQLLDISHEPVVFEIPIVIEFRLIHPDSQEVWLGFRAQVLERRVIAEAVAVRFVVNVGERAQQ